ncbi:MAG: FHIPEP family type III secretion protein, partial [Acidobacteriia bacterium]|nr:FHIPEP family type III secretion protein [Terriglobia bacterium]
MKTAKMEQILVIDDDVELCSLVSECFTLDAMPGKQMSIDADMRSGIIDAGQARELRLALAKESQLYGAMDGAMKFVKGDVIAGIVIAVINIVAGLIIGVSMHGMSALQAAQTYTVLSIGSGLVSQIPSLLISMTAGIVTTRVSSEKKDAHLGTEISQQLLGQPKAIMIAAVVLLLFAFVPGFPKVIFVVLAVLVGALGTRRWYKSKQAVSKAAAGMMGVAEAEVEGHAMVRGPTDEYALTLPIILEIGKNLSVLMKKDRGGTTFIEEMVPKMRHALYQDLGVRFPGVHIRTDSPNLETDEYAIFLNEVPVVRGKIPEGYLLVNEQPDILRKYNIPFTQSKTMFGQPSVWVDNRYQEVLQKAGVKFWKPL